MKIAKASVGAKGIDTAAKLTREIACALKAEIPGLEFVARYIGLGAPSPGDLTRAELDMLLSEGLGVMLVQHVRIAGWQPTEGRGHADGAAAAQQAMALGIPSGMVLWNDLEGIHGTGTDVIAYASAWCAVVRAAGYLPGAYIGSAVPLTSREIFGVLPYVAYWSSGSFVQEQSGRGWQMYQLFPSVAHGGIAVDIDCAQEDRRGSRPLVLVA